MTKVFVEDIVNVHQEKEGRIKADATWLPPSCPTRCRGILLTPG